MLYGTGRALLGRAAVTPWYLAGGIAGANCVAAYCATGTADIAASYVNLANPGTYNLTTTAAPTWATDTGWTFNGTDEYLDTGITPTNDQSWSMFVAIDGYSSGTSAVGSYSDAAPEHAFNVCPTASVPYARVYWNGGKAQISSIISSSGIIGFAGTTAYFHDDAETVAIAAAAGAFPPIYVGAVSSNTAAVYYWGGTISALAIYNATLSAAQVTALADAMSALSAVGLTNYYRHQYKNLGFGAFICWNMPTFTADEIADADMSVDTFAPTDLDIDQWLDAAVGAGMTYAVLTVKHPDGFALWPTTYAVPGEDPYSVAQTAWYAANGSPDVVALFVAGCRARGLAPCLYYSMWDLTHEARSGTDETSDAAAYLAMIQTQLNELLTGYGFIPALWFDGWGWHLGYEEIAYATIYNYVKGISPNTVIVENSHTHPTVTSEIEEYEIVIDGAIPAGNLRYSEQCETIRTDGHWFYHVADDPADLQTTAYINAAKANANNNMGTYLLAVTPGTDGHIPAQQLAILAAL